MVEVLSDGGDLAQFELGETQTTPALSGADERAEHELEHRLLAEAIGNDLQPSTLLDEQPFEDRTVEFDEILADDGKSLG